MHNALSTSSPLLSVHALVCVLLRLLNAESTDKNFALEDPNPNWSHFMIKEEDLQLPLAAPDVEDPSYSLEYTSRNISHLAVTVL
jgi:hypothetical protein